MKQPRRRRMLEKAAAAVRHATHHIQKTLSRHGNHSADLLELQAVDNDLSQHSVESRATLRARGVYPPCEAESTEDESSTSWYETDDGTKPNTDSDIYDLDSDGCPTNYDGRSSLPTLKSLPLVFCCR